MRSLGPYRMFEALGRGAEGTVFAGEDSRTGEPVAVKVWDSTDSDESMRELGFLRDLTHRGIVRARDAFIGPNGEPVLVMDRVDGEPFVAAFHAADEAARVTMTVSLLEALGYLHQRGLLHGDLKPENVRVTQHGPVLLDFGLATRHHRETFAGGTPAYLAPELIAGENPSPTADLFSVGVMILQGMQGKEVPRRTVPVDLEDSALARVLPLFLARNPKRRFPDAASALARLREIASDSGVPQLPSRLPFVGRAGEMEELRSLLRAFAQGAPIPARFRIAGVEGSGRRRLLDEFAMDVRLANFPLVRFGDGADFEPQFSEFVRALNAPPTPEVFAGDPAGLVDRAIMVLERLSRDRRMVLMGEIDANASQTRAFLEGLIARDARRVASGQSGRYLIFEIAESSIEAELRLTPLSRGDVRSLVSLTLGAPRSHVVIRTLAAAVSTRSAGIPGPIERFLRACVERRVLTRRDGELILDERGLEAIPLLASDATLKDALERLSPVALRLLRATAAATSWTKVSDVAEVMDVSLNELEPTLEEMIAAGWIRRRRERIEVLGAARREAIAQQGAASMAAIHARWATHSTGVTRLEHLLLGHCLADVRNEAEATLKDSPSREGLRARACLQRMEQDGVFPAGLPLGLQLLDGRLALQQGDVEAGTTRLRVLLNMEGPHRTEAAVALGIAAMRRGDLKEAISLGEQAVTESGADDAAKGRALAFLALTSLRSDQDQKAFAESEEATRALGDDDREGADAWNVKGLSLVRLGRLAEGRIALERARQLLVASERTTAAAVVGANLGNVLMRLTGYVAATTELERAVRTLESAGERVPLAQALNNLAILYADAGRTRDAVLVHQRAGRMHEDAGDEQRAAHALAGEGIAWSKGGWPHRAVKRLLDAASRLPRNDYRARILVGAHLARCHGLLGRQRRASREAAEVLRLARLAVNNRLRAEAWLAAAWASSSLAARERRARRALAAAERAEEPELIVEARMATVDAVLPSNVAIPPRLLGELAIRGTPDLRALGFALRHARRSDRPLLEMRVRMGIVMASLTEGRHARAHRHLLDWRRLLESLETEMTRREGALFRLTHAANDLERLSEMLETRLGTLGRVRDAEVSVELASVMDALAALSTEVREADLLARMLDGVFRITRAEHGFIVLREGPIGLRFAASRRRDGSAVKVPDDHVSRSVILEALAEGKVMALADAREDPEYGRLASVRGGDLRSLCLIPIKNGPRSFGVLYLDGGAEVGVFAEADIPVLEGFARLCAIALERSSNVRDSDAARSRLELSLRTERTRSLEKRRAGASGAGFVLGRSKIMVRFEEVLDRAALAELPILISGESGTGKELVARELHRRSLREGEPFIAQNCAALPENLIESELFGARKGAFTGAQSDRPGLFEVAGDGTLFLDEIGELPLAVQAKLLRVLQENEVRPLGSSVSVPVRARIIAATNRQLSGMIRDGSFREDLYYRLKVLELQVPALRDRSEDIPDLITHFLARAKTARRIESTALKKLLRFPWPGNVRQLENEILRAIALTDEDPIPWSAFSDALTGEVPAGSSPFLDASGVPLSLQELEKGAIRAVLEHTGQDRSQAARLLGISRSTLYEKLKLLDD